MDRWISILGIVAPLLAAAAVAAWRRNDKALADALARNRELEAAAIERRFVGNEQRCDERHAEVLHRFDQADERSSKLASVVQSFADLPRRVTALEHRK